MCKKLVALCFVLALTSAVFADELQITSWESGTLENWATNSGSATVTAAATRGVTDGVYSMKIKGPGSTWWSENAMIDLGTIEGGIDAFYAHDTLSIDISAFQDEWTMDTAVGWTTSPGVNVLLNPGSGQWWNMGNSFQLGQPLSGNVSGTMTVNYRTLGEQIGNRATGQNEMGVIKIILEFVNYGYLGATYYVDNFRLSGDPLNGVPVPEPATMALLGLGSLALLRRKK
jgi:hypothetical protein